MVWFQTLLNKEVKRVFRIRKQTLLPPIITSTLYFLVFWTFVGTRIGPIEGVSYIEFIIPWLIMMSVIMASYGNTSSSFFGTKFQKSIEELMVSPIPHWQILLGYVMGWVVRWFMVWILVLFVSMFFADISFHNIWFSVVVLFLSAFLFALGWFLNGVFAKSFDDVNIIPTFIITPMTYLGWVFYSVSFMSEFWQTVSKFNPILYMINWLRYWFIGISDINQWIALWMLLVFVVWLTLLNLHLLRIWYWMKN